MRKKLSQTAFTLFELIISLVFVVLISLGLMAVNAAISNNGQDYGQKFAVKSQTQATVNHIVNNVSLAVGSGGNPLAYPNNPAFYFPSNSNYFCIHQNIAPPGGGYTVDNAPVLNTPTDTSNDRWLCYTWFDNSSSSPYQIQYCATAFTATLTPSACAAGSNYLGTAFVYPTVGFTFPSAASPNAPVLFTITVNNCLNNSALNDGNGPHSCNTNGTSSDPVHNPEIQITQYVTPSQVGP